jgi:subtilase family serine protease
MVSVQRTIVVGELTMIPESKLLTRCFFLAAIILLCGNFPALGADLKVLPGHVPKVLSSLTPKGRLAATNELWLAIGLPLRDRAGLENFVAQVSDPASPNFRHFLTREELTARFGPTEQDYEAIKNFTRTNGLAIAVAYDNRLVLDVTGPAAAVEKAFHITLRTYRHPTEARDFFAPDTEPMVDANLPVLEIEGLNNFSRPHPKRTDRHVQLGTPKKGSSPDGNGDIFGDDFRNAYVPGTTLTGAGQSVGLFEWDGSYSNSVAAYAKAAGGGRTNIVIQYVLIHNFNGQPTSSGEPEVDMDIEMAMAIAPGLSKIVVFEGNPNINSPISILNTMAASNSIMNLSCSWGWSPSDVPYTNTDAVFLEMAAQGQSFFNASGDSGAFTTGSSSTNGVDNPSKYNLPSSDPYITQVGGTILNMNGSGTSWNSELVWNDGVNAKGTHFNNSATSGGISSYYSIPTWQTNISNMVGRGGSASFRNIPDVAACADYIYEILGKNATPDDSGGGTSAAAPLWAGFMALVNQRLAANGQPSAGFINPALYAIAARTNYTAYFHDVTSGSNTWSESPNLFYATNGYDLCTGLGTMNGTNLINALTVPLTVNLLIPHTVGTNFQFQFLSQVGFTHAVQYGTNLVLGGWQSYTNVTGDGTLKTISIPLSIFSPSKQGFVRVLTQ